MSTDDRELANEIKQLRWSIDKFREVLERMLESAVQQPKPPHQAHRAAKP